MSENKLTQEEMENRIKSAESELRILRQELELTKGGPEVAHTKGGSLFVKVLSGIFAMAVFLMFIGFITGTNDGRVSVPAGGNDTTTDSDGKLRNCIRSALGGAPSCSDCEKIWRTTSFNGGSRQECRGIRSAGGDRCELECR
ncbi:MAG: hypothetical protein UT05_C0009G0012 [Parcubacteria group bacterium GW2011_GWF2_38_76]|nr:MAG: hypothetical protein UT05_C0009G0012 [Parcubacteria group bacterium GW2011_GWF2_38_76]HBM45455.1 hypothetical protein [Patescibacteria group bacterium]